MTESSHSVIEKEENMDDTADNAVDDSDNAHGTDEEINGMVSETVNSAKEVDANSSNDNPPTEPLKNLPQYSEGNNPESSHEGLLFCKNNLCCDISLTCEHSDSCHSGSLGDKPQTVPNTEITEFQPESTFDDLSSGQTVEIKNKSESQEFVCSDSLTHGDAKTKEMTIDFQDNKALYFISNCKLSSSADSLSCSDTPLESFITSNKKSDADTKGSDHSNANPPCQFSDDNDDSFSELNSDFDYAETELFSSLQAEHAAICKNTKKPGKRRSRHAVGYYETQIEFLENSNKKLLQELAELKNRQAIQENEYKKKQVLTKNEFDAKIGKLSQFCETLKKEKETMVIRYANSEKEVILMKKAQAELEKKLKENNKDRDNLSGRIKNLLTERQRLCANLDQKMAELFGLQKENERLKEDMSCKDIKIKWVQNKLKTEMDSHKETKAKLEHNIQRLQEKREESEQIRKDCQAMIRQYQEAEEIKSVKLDHQLKEKLSELEVQRQERTDQEEVYQLLRQELDALKKKQRITIEENNNLTLKIHGLERERLEYEQTLSKLKDNLNSLKQEVVDLTSRLSEMHNLDLQLQREKEKVSANVREIERLRQTNAELQADMDACHMKEGELLEFTERLTDKTVHLQAEHSILESKAQDLEKEVAQLNKKNSEMEQKIIDLTTSLEEEQKEKLEETQMLARKLAEKTKSVEQLTIKLEEADNENRVMKRRHIASIKELSRELHQCRKQLEVFEKNTSVTNNTNLGSRASSSASLDAVANSNTNVVNTAAIVPQVSPQIVFSGGKSHNTGQNTALVPQEVSKQMLIERIVKLQKLLAKKNEKIEFLEDHNMQLVKEVKKKSKIIQHYVIKEETGALTSRESDQNKHPRGKKSKLDLAKRGGIMASVYSSQQSDSHMTLDLSLEINQKLQAVLEDTLLKNITLKENMSTLGDEIARLTEEKSAINNQPTKHRNVK